MYGRRCSPVRITAALIVLAAIVLVAGCSDPTAAPPVATDDLSAPWARVDPSAVGMDEALLAAALDEAGTLPRMRSLLVVREGFLVSEAYFNGATATNLADVRSVTKSVVSLLTGLALSQGHIGSLDETLADHLPDLVDTLPPAVRGITIRQLLTMTAGFEWDELGDDDYLDWIAAPDPVAFLLSRPLVDTPGMAFTYNSAAVHLLGVLLSEAVAMSLSDYADAVLFGPLRIERREWEVLNDGGLNGGAGLDLLPEDLARIGQLVLQRGWSGERELVPEAWIGASTAAVRERRSTYGPLAHLTYGYLWWVEDDPSHRAVIAWGYGGQFIVVDPSRRMVVVATSEWRDLDIDGANAQETAVLEIIFGGVLAAGR